MYNIVEPDNKDNKTFKTLQRFRRTGGQHFLSGRISRQPHAPQVDHHGDHVHAAGARLSAGRRPARSTARMGVAHLRRPHLSHVALLHSVQQQHRGRRLCGLHVPAGESEIRTGHGPCGRGVAHSAARLRREHGTRSGHVSRAANRTGDDRRESERGARLWRLVAVAVAPNVPGVSATVRGQPADAAVLECGVLRGLAWVLYVGTADFGLLFAAHGWHDYGLCSREGGHRGIGGGRGE